ncbi:MAG: sulfatase-like hydrolase/transferase [Acidobacteria bacterium]|nr:sulfatase-like hydrolase/transferase [Acidobacteriota bacterium]
MKGRVFLATLVYVGLANVPVWLASRLLGFSLSGLFNIEYIAIGIVSLFANRVVTVCLLLAVTAIDLTYDIGRTYMFRPAELLESASSALVYAGSHVGSIAAVILAMAAVCILAVIVGRVRIERRERVYTISALTAVACLGVAVDCGRMKVTSLNSDFEQGGSRIVRNSLHRILLDEIRLRHAQIGTSEQGTAIVGASKRLIGHTAMDSVGGERPNIVLVVVESWGKPWSEDVDKALIAPYMTPGLEQAYTVTTGTVSFSGPTVSAEMRELCGSTLGLSVLSAPASTLKGCLPDRVERMGYHTIAIHGFAGTMFERISWYKKLHFDETWFQDQLLKEGLPTCPGPLAGICDAAIPGWIDRRLQHAEGPQFVYWLTLNSHLPVPVNNLVKDPPACSSEAFADDGICAWYRLVFNVHRSVAELAMKETAKPTIFVVVGDHAPPFTSMQRRNLFSYDMVPYVVLSPKDMKRQQPANSIATAKPNGRGSARVPVEENSALMQTHGRGD